jgi:RHS repeat-associated protein
MAMADTTSNDSSPELADIPQIQSFQFEGEPIGQIRKSINLFRGDVNLPLQLASLEADHGLSIQVTAIYDGSSCHQVDLWNRDTPTGILGLGWSLPIEQIVASRSGEASAAATRYYLQAAGMASEMVPVATDSDGSLLFQLEGYQFWRIRYYAQAERWEITKEDGTTSIYGGSSAPGTSDGNAVQWGVALGNWMMASAQTAGQIQIPVAWNLRQVVALGGHSVTYGYDVVTQQVGSNGRAYTKACYLSSITDSTGRSIALLYGEKTYQAGQLCEYQDPHKPTPNNNPDGYQSCYQTRYLDRITVTSGDGTRLSSVAFSYDFFNASTGSDPAYPFLFKRILTAVHLRNANDDPLPGMIFAYNPPRAVAQGMLAAVTYPQGATASYGYTSLSLPSARQERVTNPFTGSTPGIPRVWHGPDYTVVTWIDTVGKRLQVSTYSWSGRWVDWTPASIQNAQVDLDTLIVATTETFFAIFYRDLQTGQGTLLLYRRDPSQFGNWTRTIQTRAMGSGPAGATLAAGDDFVLIASPVFTGGNFFGAWWNWRQNAWGTPLLPTLPVSTPAQIAIAGVGNAYVVCSYNPGSKSGAFQLISLSQGQWKSSGWNASMEVLQGSGGFPFAWSLLPSGAVATYLTTLDSANATGRMLTFQWDANYQPVSPVSPITTNLASPVVNGKMVVDLLATQSAGATVGNGIGLSRYVGGGVANWATHALDIQISASASYSFAYGPDAGVMVKSAGGSTNASFSSFNPNIPNSGGWSQNISVQQASAATVGEGVATIGTAIYQQQTNGTWTKTATLLAAQGRNVDPASIQNRAPGYIAYQDSSGTNALTYVALVRNGVVQPAISLAPDPQLVAVPNGGAGTQLAGALAFVTYPATASFDTAPYLTLYRVVNKAITGPVTDAPVTSIEVANGFDDAIHPSLQQAYRYTTAGMTLDTVSGLAQFPLVSMIAGTTDPGGATPYGRTDYYFSNGLASAAQQFYPAGWVWNYAGILNGSLLATVARDAAGTVQSSDVTWFQIYNSTADMPNLYGAYARAVKKIGIRDGVQTVADAQYDSRSGLKTLVTSASYLGGSVERQYRQTTTYAFQVPAYAGAMRSAWALTPVAQQVMESDGAAISARATTYRNWATGTGWGWAAEKAYTWSGTGNAGFDFASGQANPDWMLSRTILARNPAGRIAARADAMGLVTSYLFDTTGHFQVAGFTNADVTANEAGFAGFEPYDPIDGWTIAGGAAIVAGDAHSGSSALSVPPGATGLARDFVAAAGDMLLVAWIKTPAGFAQDGGTAQWQVDVAGTATSFAIADSGEAWAPLVARIPATAGQAVTVRCVNGKATASFLVDDVRVGPFVGGFSARAFDLPRRLVTARLDGVLATRKYLYDSYGAKIGSLGPDSAAASVQQLTTDVLSRECQASDAFDPAMPNATTTVTVMGASAYLDLAAGTPLASQYAASPAAGWKVSGNTVLYSGGAGGSLVATGAGLAPPCVFRFTVESAAALQNPLAAALSDNGTSTAAVTFDPATGAFTLAIAGSTIATNAAPILALPSAAAASLDQGQVTADIVAAFTARGWPLTLAATVAVRTAGSAWTITDTATTRHYYVAATGSVLNVAVLPREWALIVGTRSLLFLADGIQLFGTVTAATLTGLPGIFAADPLTFATLIVASRQQTSASYADGTARKLQAQSVHDDGAIVQQSVFDAVGNLVAQTKAATVPGTGRTLLAFADDFVTAYDRASGAMQGLVADAYPADQGYPYSGRRFEASPLARPVETGRAGKDFAIDLTVPVAQRHTTSYAYGANDGSGGLPANQYSTTTTTSPRGAKTIAYADKGTGLQVGKTMNAGPGALSSGTVYGPGGDITAINTPNHYAPPAGTTADDWVIGLTHDANANLLSQTTPNQGTAQYVYDPVGRLRFTCDAQGAADGYIVYTKYDVLGRPVETGAYDTAFDRAALQAKADTDPDWPQGAAWQKRSWWDGDGSVPTTIGQLARCDTANAVPGTADVSETFGYDISGRVVAKHSQVDGQPFDFAYAYDPAGNVRTITYPQGSGIDILAYAQDDLSRIVTVGTPADPAAYSSYRYGADGNIDTETFQPETALPIDRVIGHNPPGWISGIQAQAQGGAAIFGETLTYTSGGWPNGQGWYDGSIAEIDFAYAGAGGSYSYRLDYDGQGQLTAAKDLTNASFDYGIAAPVVYDANGNIRGTSVGAAVLDYVYAAGSGDRLQAINATASPLARKFAYDANGNVTGVSGGRTLTIGYDRASALAMTVTTPAETLSFAYDGGGRRIAKRATAAPKTYGYGTSPQPLVEWVGGAKTPTAYVYGPAGLAAVIGASGTYFVFRDHERSPRVLCATDGTLAASFDYLPFGTIARENGDATLTDRRFTGQEYDPETGLYHFGSRLYDADVGRFLAPDPRNQFFSPYLYAANNPLSFVDPTGQFAIIAALVEGLADLIAVSVVASETTEVVATTTTTVTSIAEGTEAVATGAETVSTAIGTGSEIASGDSLVATSAEATTTSLSEASSVASEAAEVENVSVSSLESSSAQTSVRQYNPTQWLRFRGDLGGQTALNRVPWNTWPMNYLNNLGLSAYDPVVTNFDAPGTFGYIDTAAHEGFHAAVARYLPFITWIEDAPVSIGGFRIGAPLLWAEETTAYSIGHLAAGRIFAVPLAPLEAFGSMSGYVPDALVNTMSGAADSIADFFAGLFV